MNILTIEYEPAASRELATGLAAAGYEVSHAPSAEVAEDICASQAFAALIVNVLLPGMNGVEFVRRLRAAGSSTPVLLLSTRDDLDERVQGLNAGGDDYMVKPFAFAEMIARLRAILRRSFAPPRLPDRIAVANLEWDPALRRVTRDNHRIDLSPKEYALAALLLQHKGEIVSRTQIAQAVWGLPDAADNNAVDVQIRRLRKKLDEPYPQKLIHTLRGVGVVLESREG